jgi:hypothetical protein
MAHSIVSRCRTWGFPAAQRHLSGNVPIIVKGKPPRLMRSRGAIAAPLDVALAWVLTLPAAMILSGCLYLVFSRLF